MEKIMYALNNHPHPKGDIRLENKFEGWRRRQKFHVDL